MKYLLDVNSLLALAVLHHEFHPRVTAWGGSSCTSRHSGIRDLLDHRAGIVRVLGQAQPYGSSVTHGRELLLELTNTKGFAALSFRITIIALRRTVQSLQLIASTTSIERAHLRRHFTILWADPNSAATMLARPGTKVSPTIVQLHRFASSGLIASSHPIQSGAFSKSSSERNQDMIELNIREWIRRERLERESDKNAEKWATNGSR